MTKVSYDLILYDEQKRMIGDPWCLGGNDLDISDTVPLEGAPIHITANETINRDKLPVGTYQVFFVEHGISLALLENYCHNQYPIVHAVKINENRYEKIFDEKISEALKNG